MLAQVSHDLRTPLNGILGFAQLIEHGVSDSADPARRREYACDISAAARELLGRIEDLLIAAEGETAEKTPSSGDRIAVAPLLKSTIAEFETQAERREVAVTLLSCPDSWHIVGSRQDCHRIPALLLEIALRGAPAGSTVEIGCRRDETGEVVIFCTDRGDPLDLEEVARTHLQAPNGRGQTRNPAAQPRSSAGLLALRALARRNGAALTLTERDGGGLASSVIFPPFPVN